MAVSSRLVSSSERRRHELVRADELRRHSDADLDAFAERLDTHFHETQRWRTPVDALPATPNARVSWGCCTNG